MKGMLKGTVYLLFGVSQLLGTSSDGPYVVISPVGEMSAWHADATAGGLVKREVPVHVGDTVYVGGVGARPAFSVELRSPVLSPTPDTVADPGPVPVFLLADTHGEFEIATELLISHKVIDVHLNWQFGRGRLVVLGDILDRGPNQTELLWLFYKLESEARAFGGEVYVVLGNHETMVLSGNLGYLNSRYFEIGKTLEVGKYSELLGRKTLLGGWLRSKATAFKLGKWLFLHGGLSLEAAAGQYSLREMNETIRAWLNDKRSTDGARYSFITGKNGPLWYRGWFERLEVEKDFRQGNFDETERLARHKELDRKGVPRDIDAIKKFYGVERIAVGHTIVPTVTSLYNGSVIAVQVYPTKDKTTDKMNMEGVYIDEQGVWHKAKIDGSREILRDDAGNPIRNGVPTPAAGTQGSPDASSPDGKPASEPTEKPAEQKKAA